MINESICVCQYWRSAQKWILIFFKLSLKCMHSHVVWQLMCVISLCTKVLILSPCILIDYENSLSNSCSIHVSREHMVGWVNWSTKLSWDKQTQIMTDWGWQNSWLNILRLLFYHLKCCCIFCLFQVLAHAMVVAQSKPVLAIVPAGTAHLVATGVAHLIQLLVSTDNVSKTEFQYNLCPQSHMLLYTYKHCR